MRRRIAAATAGALIALLPFAAAHPDAAVIDGSLLLAPGDVRAYPMAVHFHRLVATYRVDGPGSVELQVVAGADASTGGVAYEASLADRGRLHHLIECCDAVFSDYTLVVRNAGAEPVGLDLRAWIVHDEFAVIARAAEAGAVEVPGGLFLGLGIGAVLAGAAVRRRRSRIGGTEAPHEAAGAHAYRWSVRLFLSAVVAALVLGTAGALRYGTGFVTGMMAIMADVPVPGGPFGSRAAFLIGVLLLVWIVAVWLWIVAARRGRDSDSGRVAVLGVALAVVHSAGGVAVASAYGAWLVPVGLGVVLAAPLAASAIAIGSWRGSGGARPHEGVRSIAG
jgi:hypothetical protein